MLEKREAVLQKKCEAELNAAKQFSKDKNKRAALQALKKKKLYEGQMENLANQQLRVQDQLITLEGARMTTETVSALKQSAAEMKRLSKQVNIENVDKTMDELNEQTDAMRQIQEALGQPVGPSAEFDDEELDAELAELEELELDGEMTAMPAAPAAAQPAEALPAVPARPVAAPSSADAELEELRREMELMEAA